MKRKKKYNLMLTGIILLTILIITFFIIIKYKTNRSKQALPQTTTEASTNSDTSEYDNFDHTNSDYASSSLINSETDTVSENANTEVDSLIPSESASDCQASSVVAEHEPSPDRVVYKSGFYYESLTEWVKDRIYGLSYKKDCTIPYEDLRYLSLQYYDFDGKIQTGEIICSKLIAEDLIEIFYELYQNEYQIDKIRLVDEYNADDDLSCADNNTSCFNYRTVEGSANLSNHAKGLAIDINPFQNPYITYPNGKEHISPEGSEPYADRNSGLSHMITEDDLCYKLFTEHGFKWGGHWKSLKDYQHFEKKF